MSEIDEKKPTHTNIRSNDQGGGAVLSMDDLIDENQIAKGVAEGSPLQNKEARESLAYALGAAVSQLKAFRMKAKQKPLSADEAKYIPTLCSNIKRLCDALRVTEVNDDDEDI